MANLFKKLKVGARLAASPEVWRVAAAGALRSGRTDQGSVVEAPRIIERERDLDAGLKRIEVDGLSYWEPSAMDCQALVAIHDEVFHKDHPHYYEYQGCRIEPGDVVVDAGASEGFFTRFALDRGARVLAVEPWAVQAEALRRTFASEAAEGRLLVAQVALSDREGEASLEIDPAAPWGATLGKGYRATLQETVPQTTLDRLVATTWGRCDFLKADVEGAEVPLTEGGRGVIARDRPRVAIAVYHAPTNYLDVRGVLHSLGVGYRVTGKGLYRHRFVWLPRLLHAWVPTGR